MKNLIVAGMLSLFVATSVLLCVKQATQAPIKPLKPDGGYIEIVEPDIERLEYAQEQYELENNTRHWVDLYPLLYDVPLSGQLQHHIQDICTEYDVDMELVLAIIERESQYNADAVSADGLAYGLMQIVTICHKERMERLEVTDILNEYQNVEVGIDTLAYLFNRYGRDNVNYVLMCYNMGEGNAAKCSKTETAYTREILEIKEKIHAVKFSDDTQTTKCNKWERVQATVQ